MTKLNPIAIRLSAFTFTQGKPCKRGCSCLECNINLSIPVELTGFYDIGADGRIDRVEIYIPGDTFIWVAPDALQDEFMPMPIDYKTLRRALLILWITGANRHRDFGGRQQYQRLTSYQRLVSSKDAY